MEIAILKTLAVFSLMIVTIGLVYGLIKVIKNRKGDYPVRKLRKKWKQKKQK